MAQPLSTPDNTAELSSLKHGASNVWTSIRQFGQRLSRIFWAFTEESGKADTSSFRGML